MTLSCKDCKNRKQGCHIDCEDYKKFRQERDEFNAKVKSTREKYKNLRDYEIQRIEKIKKSQNKR